MSDPNTTDQKHSMVVYSDGSCRPNPGYIGYGFHGYTYKPNDSKKVYGSTTHYLSPTGYKAKEKGQTHESVCPITIFDGFGSWIGQATNNAAEIRGATEAMRLALRNPIRDLLIKTDSEYVQKGYTNWLPKWIHNDWKNSEGQPVSNQEHWKSMHEAGQALKDAGIKLKIDWVKGHVGHPGNERADKLANIGRITSQAEIKEISIKEYDPNTYWNRKDIEPRHPLASKSWMYFRTIRDSHIKGEYYFGNIGKDEDFLGKRDANGGYSIVQLKKPDTTLELIKNFQSNLSGSNDAVVVVKLAALFHKERLADLHDYGDKTLIRVNPRRLDLFFVDALNKSYSTDDENAEPITREQKPLKLSARVFDALTVMKQKLVDYQNGDTRHNTYYDITDSFYTQETKAVKKEFKTSFKLRPEFVMGYKSHPISVDYNGKNISIPLAMTIDCPDRNTFKHLETMNPKIVLVVWTESDMIARYSIIIECDDASSIWSGVYSNMIILQAVNPD